MVRAIESDLGEQFVSGGDIEFEVCVEHGLVSCSGGRRFRHRDRETASLFHAGRFARPLLPSGSTVRRHCDGW